MTKNKVTYTKKSSSVLYDISNSGGMWTWAKITLNEEDGSLQIQSDYGDYSYIWARHGRESLRHFLVELDDSYLGGKIGANLKANFNLELSCKAMRKELKEAHPYFLTSNELKELLREVKRIEGTDINSEDVYFHECITSEVLTTFYTDPYFPVVTTPNRDLTNFLKYIWTAFKKILIKELKEEEKLLKKAATSKIVDDAKKDI